MLACSCSVCTRLEIKVTAQMYAGHVHVYMLFRKSDDCSQDLKLQVQVQIRNMPSGMSTRVKQTPAADLYRVQHSSVACMCLMLADRMFFCTCETVQRASPGTRQDSSHSQKDCVKKLLPGTTGTSSKTKTGMRKSYRYMSFCASHYRAMRGSAFENTSRQKLPTSTMPLTSWKRCDRCWYSCLDRCRRLCL